MRLPALLLACALVACAAEPSPPAVASAEPSCRQWEPIRAIAPPAAHLTEITPAASFLAALNKLPPETEFSAERIWVARRGKEARVFFVTAGCLTDAVDIPLEDLVSLLGQDS